MKKALILGGILASMIVVGQGGWRSANAQGGNTYRVAETGQEKFIREQKEATDRANAQADRIRAEKAAADADRERVRDNQGPREGDADRGGKDD
jgi:hypothetical protein